MDARALLIQAVMRGDPPRWLVLLGGLDLEGQSIREVIQRLRRLLPLGSTCP